VLADPHTAVVFAGSAVQSVLAQQPLDGMHKVVPGQFLKPLAQVMPQAPVVALQVADPFACGVVHWTQLGPHAVVLVLAWQIPAQAC